MKKQITQRFSGAVLFECDTTNNASSELAVRDALEKAIASGTDLSYAALYNLNLSGANLSGANLYGALLSSTDLSCADLPGANLSLANLYNLNLSGANLSGANLYGADLPSADLSHANLSRANLHRADLSRANLKGANLSGAKNAELVIAQTRILPDGDLIGWKKCKDDVIVKLAIPSTARRSHAFSRKCRAEFADVLEVIGASVGVSLHDNKTEYRVGCRVTADRFDDNWQEECTGGIHFFITRVEAENY